MAAALSANHLYGALDESGTSLDGLDFVAPMRLHAATRESWNTDRLK